MAMTKTPEELAEALGFFPSGSTKAVNRLLKRAAEKQAKVASDGTRSSLNTRVQFVKALENALAKQLTKAMRQKGASKRETPSVKQKDPKTGGRSFHFAHSAVSKEAAGSGGKVGKSITKAAAHMKYIEREIAVERAFGQDREAEAAYGVGGTRLREPEGMRRQANPEVGMSSAGDAQGYIENPVKLANGENVIFSFGTIGNAFEERVRFWQELEQHEAHPRARVQNRLIVELPHEATPQARFEIVKEFCGEFERRGLPYWAALHAPGKNNDSRNFHAHIVFSERPAARMVDDADGKERWDFSIIKEKRKTSGHIMRQHPFRQNRHPDFRRKDIIMSLRKSFADATNKVLARAPAMDKEGKAVVYDARSYKNMGLDSMPMKSVDRIVADKVKSGKVTVLDGDFTKKMIRAELQEALSLRDKDLMELVRLDQALEAFAKDPKQAKAANQNLPRELRVSLLAKVTDKAVRIAAGHILDAKRAALSDDLIERSTRTSLERILGATDEKIVTSSMKNTRDPARRAELPSEEAARQLNEAAREELVNLEIESEVRRKRARYRIGLALNGWKDVVGPRLPTAGPIMEMTIAVGRQEGRALRKEAPSHQGETQTRSRHQKSAIQMDKEAAIRRMPKADLAAKVQAMSDATSAIFAQIAKIPDLEDRLRVIDSLAPADMRESPEGQRREARAQDEQRPGGADNPQIVGQATASELNTAETATVDQPLTDAERKLLRERKKRERKAILARRRNKSGRAR